MGLTYLDSCVLIDALANPEPRGAAARAAIVGTAQNSLVTSPLVDLECMVRPLRRRDPGQISLMRQYLRRFRRLEIGDRAFELGAHLRATHGLQTADALHVAAASVGGCERIWTNDEKLISALDGFAVAPGASV